MELRRAFDFIKEARLEDCLEEYVFPATEEKVWEKPVPKPPPVLTRSRSQSQSSRGNRGGYNRGGGRHGQGSQRSSGRRASSAAAMNKFSLPQAGLHGLQGRDYPSRDHLQAQYEQLQLHHDLFSKFQVLQAQEQELRLLQAQSQIHAQMQVQGSAHGGSMSQQQLSTRDPHQRTPISNQIAMTAPMRSGPFFHPFQYPQVPGTPQQSIHTQPSSPSMKPIHPDLRRSVHRSSAAENSSANHRSHSQPARPLPPSVSVQNAPPVPINSHAFLQYQHQIRQQQIYDTLEMSHGRHRLAEVPAYQDSRRMAIDRPYEESEPKEYVGYWVNDSPPQRGYREDQPVQRLPTYQDLHPRVRGVPPTFTRLRVVSRSPSPSPAMPFRDRSFSIQSAASAPPQPSQTRFERVQPQNPAFHVAAPVATNGNDGWTMPDYSLLADASSHTTTISEATSGSDERPYETPGTADIETPSKRGLDDGFVPDDSQQYCHPHHIPEPSRMPLTMRNGNADSSKTGQLQPVENITSSTSTEWAEKPRKSAGGLGIQFGEHEIRRPSLQAEGKVSPNITRSIASVPSLEPKPEQKAPIPIPLLSPVREVRTPSPTAKRRDDIQREAERIRQRQGGSLDLYIPPFAELLRSRQEKERSASAQISNGIMNSHVAESMRTYQLPRSIQTNLTMPNLKTDGMLIESPKGTVHPPQTNGWQQQSSKKSSKARSRHGSTQIPGEQMPVNEAERKGG